MQEVLFVIVCVFPLEDLVIAHHISLQLVRLNESTPSHTVSLMFTFIPSYNFPTFLLSAPFPYQSFSILHFCMFFHLFLEDYLLLTFYIPLFHHIHNS